MTTYIWRDNQWQEKPERDYRQPWGVMVMRDIPEYRSPLGTGLITSRSHRREDLKRGDCREVDPSEFMAAPRRESMLDRTAKMDAEIAGPLPEIVRSKPVMGE